MKQFVTIATWDRVLRVILGLALLYLGWFGPASGLTAVALQLFGWIPLLTGLVGWCPFYALLDVSTRRRPRAH